MILYKYYPENINSIKSISSNSFWAHSPLKMNDPLESLCLLNQNYDLSEIEIFRNYIINNSDRLPKEWLGYNNEQLIECINFIRRNILSSLAFASFSESYDNILMWSHYASSHKGFCIAYDFPDSLLNENDLVKISYNSKIENLNISSLICTNESSHEDLIEMKRDFIKNLSIKSPEWSYEKEWRLWSDEMGYIKLDNVKLKEIYFGYSIDEEFKNITLNILKSTIGIDNIKVNFLDFAENSTTLKTVTSNDHMETYKKRKKLENGEYIDIKYFL